jgi:hypothetical protein
MCLLGGLVVVPFFQNSVAHGVLSLVMVLLIGVVAMRGWQRSPIGCLQWREPQWHWSGWDAVQISRVRVLFDFQKLVLIRIRGEASGPLWLWLEESRTGDPEWIKLRRALVGHAGK